MDTPVARGAEGDEVWLGVVAEPAPRLDVVDLEVSRPAAGLAAPTIPLQYLLAKSTVGLRVEPEAGAAWVQASHEAFLNCSKNCFCCGGGRN